MVVDFMLRENVLQEMLNPKSETQDTVRWMIYYLSSLLWNAMIISFYIVQVFTEHEDCFTTRNKNLLYDMELAYYVGFSVIVLDTINGGVISFYVRFKTKENSSARLYS